MAKLDNMDLGTVRTPQRRRVSRRLNTVWTGDGFNVPQDVGWVERGWDLVGTLGSLTAAKKEDLEGLVQNPEPVLLDLDDIVPGFICWVIVEDVETEPVGNILRYSIRVRQIPCIGTMYMQTPDVYLHDLNYRASYKILDPFTARCSREWSAGRLTQTWQGYIDNDKDSGQTAILEIWIADDVSRLQLWAWKAGQWSVIADWGNADAWGAQKVWSDGDAVSHNFKANTGGRGQAVSGIGTISWMLGNYCRILMSISNLTADANPALDLSTHYDSDQLLLKLALTSASREALRPNPVVTYITGSLGVDPA